MASGSAAWPSRSTSASTPSAGWYRVDAVRLELGPFLLGGLGGYFLVALWEELLLRGVLFRLLEVLIGSIGALILSSIVFGMLHLGNPGATVLGAVTSAAGGGVVFGTAYLLTRTLWLAIGLHWAADFWQGAFFGLHPAGTNVEHPLIHSTLDGPALWVGDRLGGRLVALAIFLPSWVGKRDGGLCPHRRERGVEAVVHAASGPGPARLVNQLPRLEGAFGPGMGWGPVGRLGLP